MIRLCTLLSLAMLSNTPTPQVDPLDGMIDETIDIEIRGASIDDVLLLVGDIARAPLKVDPCVQGTVDLNLRGVTVRVLLESLASLLDLSYTRDAQGELVVGCVQGASEPTATLSLIDAQLTEVTAGLSKASGVEVVARGCQSRRVDLDVANAPLDAVVSGLAARLDATVSWSPGRAEIQCSD